MGFAQSMQTRQKRLQRAGAGLRQGLRRNGLNRRESVLDSVPALVQEQLPSSSALWRSSCARMRSMPNPSCRAMVTATFMSVSLNW
jgi:hypothetical protein